MKSRIAFSITTALTILLTAARTSAQTIYTADELISIAKTIETGKTYKQVNCVDYMVKFLVKLGMSESDIQTKVFMPDLGAKFTLVVTTASDGTTTNHYLIKPTDIPLITGGTGGSKGVVETLTGLNQGSEVSDAKTIGNLKPGDIVQYWSIKDFVKDGETKKEVSGHTSLIIETGPAQVKLYGSHLSKGGVGELILSQTTIKNSAAFWAVRPKIAKH